MSARFALGLALLLFAGCSSVRSTAPQFVIGQGTVQHIDLEGGFYAIDLDHHHYTPVNLPAEAQVDGQKVSIVAITQPEIISYLPGPFIRIISLELVR